MSSSLLLIGMKAEQRPWFVELKQSADAEMEVTRPTP